MLIDPRQSLLLIVDIQEGLVPVMADPRNVLHHTRILSRAANRLEIPILATEQYPRGIGPTMGEIKEFIPENAIVEKIHFSAARDPSVMQRIQAAGRNQIIICGIESHICVLQTALSLQTSGYRTVVVLDAVSSRREESKMAAMARLADNGIELATTEMVVFEWLERGGTPEFKDIQPLVK